MSAARPGQLGANLAERGTTLHEDVRAGEWKAGGLTKVAGSVEVDRADLDGLVVVGGSLTATSLSVRGTLDVRGSVSVRDELGVHGIFRSVGAVHAGSISASGTLRSDGSISTDRDLVARGTFAGASISGRHVRLHGAVRVAGEIRAEEIELDLEAGSTVAAALGRTVKVVGPDGRPLDRVLGRSRRARVEHVEAEHAEFEQVEVGSVVARSVVLGRGAHVGRLDATEVTAHPTSRTGPESRSPPPPGLRR